MEQIVFAARESFTEDQLFWLALEFEALATVKLQERTMGEFVKAEDVL